MRLYLQYYWLNFTYCQQLCQKLTIKIWNTQVFCIAFFNTKLKFSPTFLKRPMSPFFSFWIHIRKWPVQVVQINIIQLHEFQSLFKFKNRIRINMIKCFSCNKKIFSFASILSNNSFNGLTKCNLIVIISGSIDMFAVS